MTTSDPTPVFSAAVVTVSDGVVEGVRKDKSGPAVKAALEDSGFEVRATETVPDERTAIASLLIRLCDQGNQLVVTTGGTGLGPRDVTPEATMEVVDRQVPGLAEAMRAAGMSHTPLSALSREVVGSRGRSLIVNLPGSERGAVQSLRAVLGMLPHALRLLSGESVHDAGTHAPPPGRAGRDEPRRSIEGEIAERRAAGESMVLATAIGVEGDPPCRVGQKILLGPHGPISGTLGCSEFDGDAAADAPSVLATGSPTTRTYSHELGSIEVFLEPATGAPLLLVFSASPVGLALIRWAGQIGFDPVLVEPRDERLESGAAIAGRAMSSLEGLAIDGRTAAIHTDHDAPGLAESVAALLRSPARFIGVMGSARHVGPHMDKLRELGFSEEDLARVRTPVGIDIGARTAEEIALSILAGLVADRHGAEVGWLDRR